MTPAELFKLLDDAGVDYEVIEVFDGSRWIKVNVEEEQ